LLAVALFLARPAQNRFALLLAVALFLARPAQNRFALLLAVALTKTHKSAPRETF